MSKASMKKKIDSIASIKADLEDMVEFLGELEQWDDISDTLRLRSRRRIRRTLDSMSAAIKELSK